MGNFDPHLYTRHNNRASLAPIVHINIEQVLITYKLEESMTTRTLHLNAWNVFTKMRSIEIFDRENDFTDTNEFKAYIVKHQPFDTKRQHRKKTIKNENTHFIDPETGDQKKVETFDHFRMMALQEWKDFTCDEKEVFRKIALEINKKHRQKIEDTANLQRGRQLFQGELTKLHGKMESARGKMESARQIMQDIANEVGKMQNDLQHDNSQNNLQTETANEN